MPDRRPRHARELLGELRLRIVAPAVVARRELRQTKVQHLHLAATGQENVGRLDVAMKDAFGMRRIERVGDLRPQFENRAQVEGAAGELPVECLAFEQLHREIELPLMIVEAVDRADVRVIEARRGPRLAAEALDRFLLIVRTGLRQDLERDEPAEADILRLVDHAHPASAELLDDAVLAERLADQVDRHESPLRVRSARRWKLPWGQGLDCTAVADRMVSSAGRQLFDT